MHDEEVMRRLSGRGGSDAEMILRYTVVCWLITTASLVITYVRTGSFFAFDGEWYQWLGWVTFIFCPWQVLVPLALPFVIGSCVLKPFRTSDEPSLCEMVFDMLFGRTR